MSDQAKSMIAVFIHFELVLTCEINLCLGEETGPHRGGSQQSCHQSNIQIINTGTHRLVDINMKACLFRLVHRDEVVLSTQGTIIAISWGIPGILRF